MENTKGSRLSWALPAVFACVWLVMSVKLLGLSAVSGVGFIFYTVFLLFLPGFAITSRLESLISFKEAVLISFGIGFLEQYVLYFVLAPFHLNQYIVYFLIAISLVSLLCIALYYRKNGSFKIPVPSFDVCTFICCVLAAAVTFVILSMANLEPDLVGARPYYHDTVNGVGLTVAAYKSFPMESLQMSGWVFPYHLGYYIYTSILMSVLKTTAFVAVIKLSLILIAPLCVLAFDCVADRCGCERIIKRIQVLLLTVLPSCAFIHYLYMDTIGFPFGLLLSIIALLVFQIANSYNRKINRYHLIATAFLSAAMIAKGPITVTYLFGICFILLVELIRDKNIWVFPKGLLYAVPCIGLYFIVYGNGAGDSMSLSFFYSAIRTPFSYSIYEKLPDWLYKTLSVLYYSFSMSLTVTVSLVIILIGMICLKKKSDYLTFSVAAVLCGMVLMNILKQAGSSEVYFFTGIYPICYLSAGSVICDLYKNSGKSAFRVLAAGCLAALVVLGMPQDIRSTVKLFIGDDATTESQATAFKSAMTYSIKNYKDGKKTEINDINGAVVTPQQYEAFVWLMNNTPEDAVFSDYRYSTNNKFFCASVFSQRSCYLEGWGYLTMEDSNNNTDEKIRRDTIVRFFNDTRQESFVLLLEQEGVEYLIFEKVITGDWELSDTYVDEVFRNDEVIIYHIKPVEWH